MSVAQRCTTAESVDLNPGYANGAVSPRTGRPKRKPVWRILSYDAFAPQDNKMTHFPEPKLNMAAYNVSSTKRATQVGFALLACILCSGIVCGFAALKPVLVAEGVYRDLCPDDWPERSPPCTAQDMRLNLFFISASIMLNVSTVMAGFVLDKYGRRTCYVLASFILAAGSLLMASAFALPDFDGYIAGNMLLGLGGTFVFVPSYQLANAFPKYSGIIVSMVTGAFDASAAVFLFYRMAYEATDGRFKAEYFFIGFLAVPLMILVAEFAIMPPQAYHTRPELEQRLEKAQDNTRDVHESDNEIESNAVLRQIRMLRAEARHAKLDRIEDVAGTKSQRQKREAKVEKRQEHSGVWGVLHHLPVSKQIATPWFVLMLLLTTLQMLRMNYFIATVRGQYRYMLDSQELTERVNDFFDVALPVAGVVSTPFIGILLNELTVVVTLAVLSVLIIVVGVLNCLPYLWAGYATVVAFVFLRPLYYSAMSDYSTKVFGFETFGRIFGTITCVSGLFQLVQPGLDALTHGPLKGNPVPINIFFAASGTIVSLILAGFVYFKGKSFRQRQHDEHDEERMGLIREESVYGTLS